MGHDSPMAMTTPAGRMRGMARGVAPSTMAAEHTALSPRQFSAPQQTERRNVSYWMNSSEPKGGFYGQAGSSRGRLVAAGNAVSAQLRGTLA